MVGCKLIRLMTKRMNEAEAEAEWVNGLLGSKFFGSCVDHRELRRNEKNLFCIDCNLCFCKHCVSSSTHSSTTHLHRLLQICKYVYHDVVRLHDIQKHLDCSFIQAYKINGEKAVHLNPRPQQKDAKNSKGKGGGTTCEACGRHIQDLPNRFCSIACKVSIDTEMNITQSHNIISTSMSKVEHLPNLEAEENSSENGYGSSSQSLTESSEVIQAAVCDRDRHSSSLRPKKVLRKRKSLPTRSPFC